MFKRNIVFVVFTVIFSCSIGAQSIVIDYINKKQQISMIGADMERSQSFLQRAANPQEVADWLFKDIAFTTCRVSYDKKQELIEGQPNLGFYDDAIKSMKMVQNANPTIKFYATMKSDYNGYNNENNLPDWICDYRPTTFFNANKYAAFLADYLKLMHNNGVTIHYLSVAKEWSSVVTVNRTIDIINALTTILRQQNVPIPLFTDPGSWSVDQGISFVNEVNSKRAAYLFHAFSTHDYNSSASKYPNFVAACQNAGKPAWNDETSVGSGGRTNGAEPFLKTLIDTYAAKTEMYRDGISGEILFENFSRGVNAETRSIYFSSGQIAKRLRSYYVSKEFSNHINNHFYVPTTINSMPNLKTMSFVDEDEIALCVINPTETEYLSANIRIANATVNGLVTQHLFDSLTIIQGDKKQINASNNGEYSVNIKPNSLIFFRFPLKTEANNETLTLSEQELVFSSQSQNATEKKYQTVYFSSNNASSDISIEIINKIGNSFSLKSPSSYSKANVLWFIPIEIELDRTFNGAFSADLRVSTSGKSISIPLSAEVLESEVVSLPFVEMFPNTIIKTTAISNSDINSFSTYKGWEIHNGYSSATDRINVTASEVDPGFFLTPEIDFDGPFELKFNARMLSNDQGLTAAEKIANNIPRNFYAVIGSDTIYDHKKNGATLYQNYNEWVCTFALDGIDRIKFFPKVSNQGVWATITDGLSFGAKTTGVRVQQTTLPTVNVGFGKSIFLGEVEHGITKRFTFQLKGWNLSSNLQISQSANSKVSIITNQFVPVDGVVDAEVNVEIDAAHLSTENHIEKITLRSENNQIKDRTIWLSFDVVQSTGMDEIQTDFKLFTIGNKLVFRSDRNLNLKVYSISGVIMAESQLTNYAEFNLYSGIYIVKVGKEIRKIII